MINIEDNLDFADLRDGLRRLACKARFDRLMDFFFWTRCYCHDRTGYNGDFKNYPAALMAGRVYLADLLADFWKLDGGDEARWRFVEELAKESSEQGDRSEEAKEGPR